MTALDIAVLILIGWTAVRGVMRGFVAEVLGLSGIFAGMLALRFFHAPVTELLTGLIGTSGGAAILAFAIVFGGIFGIAKLAAAKIGQTSRASVLGPIDRALGFGFGGLKGLLFATVLFMLFSLFYNALYGAAERKPDAIRTAHVFPLLSASSMAMSAWLEERSHKGGLMGVLSDGDDAPNSAGAGNE
jgi:membrane protein required for colicin V production